MEANPNPLESSKQEAAALAALAAGPLASSAAKLSGRSRAVPAEKDFHFYNNFAEFKSPASEIASKSEATLQTLGSSAALWGSKSHPNLPADLDEAYDWLVNLNDEFLEQFGVSMDEFKNSRKKEEETGSQMTDGGFQMVCGKKKRGSVRDFEKGEAIPAQSGEAGVKVAARDKKTMAPRSKIPFHIPTITRPQKEFRILVNNSNRPFEHVWLERSTDGIRLMHPLEKLSVLNFVDRNVEDIDPVKPPPVESTPFKLVEGVKELKELAAKLRDVKEFAVDLEHNQYRSFLGLTCLMQISTRTEDFIVDTLKLRVHLGPYLREVFKDPAKKKVMHGADHDIMWLQRDFGIYVCNMFDTGQASRVMQLERNSLEYLLHHFCGVTANKEYQNADWRLRPLPEEMLKYAREDTHYLLHIYDLMKIRLLSTSSSENDLLLEVYKRSYEICMQLYEKELLTDTSYLYIYGLQQADFNSNQLAIASGLCEWRDKIAREEDESTGYILPNKALLEIARQMPLTSGKLHRLVRTKHPYVERHLNDVIDIIKSSMEKSSSFESIAEQLKKGRLEGSRSQTATEDPMECTVDQRDVLGSASNVTTMNSSEHIMASSTFATGDDAKPPTAEVFSTPLALVGTCQLEEKLQPTPLSEFGSSIKLCDEAGASEKEKLDNRITESLGSAKRVNVASVQISKKQTSAFGAMLGNTSSRRKFNPHNEDKNAKMVEQIKSSVSLTFHPFGGNETPSKPSTEAFIKCEEPGAPNPIPDQPAETSKLEEIIPLENGSDGTESPTEAPTANDESKQREWFPRIPENGTSANTFRADSDSRERPISLSDLSTSFRQCFQSINEKRGGSKQKQRPYQEPEINFQLKPFDYSAARQNVKFGEVGKEDVGEEEATVNPRERRKKKKEPALGQAPGEVKASGFQQPRRSQAYPLSGNRSTTYH